MRKFHTIVRHILKKYEDMTFVSKTTLKLEVEDSISLYNEVSTVPKARKRINQMVVDFNNHIPEQWIYDNQTGTTTNRYYDLNGFTLTNSDGTILLSNDSSELAFSH